MIFVTYDELRERVDMNRFTTGLLREAFDHLAGGQRQHFLFTNIDEYKDSCPQYAVEQGWNPETTLVLFEMPPTDEERAARTAAAVKRAEEDPDWDDIQIGEVNPKQIICSFYPNLTFDRLVNTLNSFNDLRAFL